MSGVDDAADDGDISYTLTGNASSSDSNYSNLTVATVSLTNTDDDTAGISITPTTLTLLEGGAGVSYDIVLMSQPSQPGTVSFSTGSQIDAIAPITFEGTNWNLPQTVTATATDDAAVKGGHTGTIAHNECG